MTITNTTTNTAHGFFKKIASVAAGPGPGLIVTRDSLIELLRPLEPHRMVSEEIDAYGAEWYAKDEHHTIYKNIVMALAGQSFPAIEQPVERAVYEVPKDTNFGAIIKEATMLNHYEEFDFLTAMMLGSSAILSGMFETNSSIYIFLNSKESQTKFTYLRFFRFGTHKVLMMTIDSVSIDMMDVILPARPADDGFIAIIGR